MRLFDLPNTWDARKFAARYGLDFNKDFYIDANGKLLVFPALSDDPPIFETPDPILPSPAGIFVHEMKALSKKQGNKLIDGAGTTCFHIVVQTEAQLSDPWFNNIVIDIGSVAFVQDKSKTLTWDGVHWK